MTVMKSAETETGPDVSDALRRETSEAWSQFDIFALTSARIVSTADDSRSFVTVSGMPTAVML